MLKNNTLGFFNVFRDFVREKKYDDVIIKETCHMFKLHQ